MVCAWYVFFGIYGGGDGGNKLNQITKNHIIVAGDCFVWSEYSLRNFDIFYILTLPPCAKLTYCGSSNWDYIHNANK